MFALPHECEGDYEPPGLTDKELEELLGEDA
jgi:hypothetical protein